MTRVLGLLGANLPRDPIGPVPGSNDLGFWESISINDMHEALLASAESAWHDWRQLNPDWYSSPLADHFRRQASALLERVYDKTDLLVLKDPRICRIVPFWHDVLATQSIDPLAILPLRNPLEIADSLRKRDGFEAAESILIWLRHALDAEFFTRDMPRVFTTYDGLLSDWKALAKHIAQTLDLNWPDQTLESEAEIEAFLSPELRHNCSSLEELASDKAFSPWVRRTSEALMQFVARPYDPQAMRCLDEVRGELNRAEALLGPALLGAHGRVNQPRDPKKDGHSPDPTDKVGKVVPPNPPVLESLQDAIKAQSDALSDLQNQVSELEQALESAREEVVAIGADRDQQLVNERAAREEMQKAEAQLEQTRNQLLQMTLDAEELRNSQIEALNSLAILQASRKRKDTGLETLGSEIKNLRQSEASLKRELGATLIEIESLRWRVIDVKRIRRRGALQKFEQDAMAVASGSTQVERADDKVIQEPAPLGQLNMQGALTLVQSSRLESEDSLSSSDAAGQRESMLRLQGLFRLVRNPGHLMDVWGTLLNKVSRLEESPLFDASWYLKQVPQVGNLTESPAQHYLTHGHDNNCDPHPLFSRSWYLARYPDVGEARIDPLLHYLLFGARERRSPHPLFQTDWYFGCIGERERLVANPLIDYLEHGNEPGINPNPLFDSDWYKELYPEVAQSGLNPLVHYVTIGQSAGYQPHPLIRQDWFDDPRNVSPVPVATDATAPVADALIHCLTQRAPWRSPHPLFDVDWYAAHFPDQVARHGHPLLAWLFEGRYANDPHPLLVSNWYSSQSGEDDEPFWDPLSHYVIAGANLNYNPHPLFDTAWYRETYRDAIQYPGTPLEHFLVVGAGMGCTPNCLFEEQSYREFNGLVDPTINAFIDFVSRDRETRCSTLPLFDAAWYSNHYEDLRDREDMDPLVHFLHQGVFEGRKPHPLFETEYYLNQFDPDERPRVPLWHYLAEGAFQGFDPHPLFSSHYYLRHHPRLIEQGGNPLQHYLAVGWREGDDPHPIFCTEWYLENLTEPLEGNRIPLVHFLESAENSARDPHPLFSCGHFRWLEPGDEIGQNPLIQYLTSKSCFNHDPRPMFSASWYRSQNGLLEQPDVNPLVHYLECPIEHRPQPHPLFDGAWYRERYPDVLEAGVDPFIHYLTLGWHEQRSPHPLFDAPWYHQQVADNQRLTNPPAIHYLWEGFDQGYQPNRRFDGDWYLAQYPDVAAANINPLLHYVEYGANEGRWPAADFDPVYYLELYPEAITSSSPLAHHLEQVARGLATGEEHYLPQGASVGDGDDVSSSDQFPVGKDPFDLAFAELDDASKRAFLKHLLDLQRHEDSEFVEYQAHSSTVSDTRLIAFYLPQFHPIPENDAWWGKGFTEWTNVSKAQPQFVGHYQPRLPGELGFYDLRLPEVQRQQIELARNYGLEGFCFHYYWFNGHRLLERPLQQFLDDKTLDFGFCVCWANENWTRKWDGQEEDVLIAQTYGESDDLAFIEDLTPVLRDQRYIRVADRPLIIVYRPSKLPDPKATAERWRRHCRAAGIGEIQLVSVQFDRDDPREFGFDAAVEFPPHKLAKGLGNHNQEVSAFDRCYAGDVKSFRDLIDRAKSLPTPAYPLIRGVSPAWDNTARQASTGTVFHQADPASYRDWLEMACQSASQNPVLGEQMVFINAWNEWGEGAYLEPDRRYGYAYLEATHQALQNWRAHPHRQFRAFRIVMVTHDCYNHGAQQNALHMIRALRRQFHYQVDIITLGPGELRPAFADEGTLHDFHAEIVSADHQQAVLERLREQGVDIAICNTTVSGLLVGLLNRLGFRTLSLIHELPSLIRSYELEDHARMIASHAHRVIFAADMVRDRFIELVPEVEDRALVQPQGLYKAPSHGLDLATIRAAVRSELDLAETTLIVLGAGWADLRKGFDLFMQVASATIKQRNDVAFVWLGCEDEQLLSWFQHDARYSGYNDRIRLLPRVEDVEPYFIASDLFLLSSREDPFPSVVLEALSHGKPVVAFADASGCTGLIQQDCGSIVPYLDTAAMAQSVLELLGDSAARKRISSNARAVIARDFNWRRYIHFLLEQLGEIPLRVSVIVPNYNYAQHLEERMRSIFAQGYPIFEVIVLDDASTDQSLDVLDQLRHKQGMEFELFVNKRNSGSVFEQWRKGLARARGDLVWIAEADDYADSTLLERLISRFDDPHLLMAYAESRQVNERSEVMADSYLDYVAEVDDVKWRSSWTRDGMDELRDTLSIMNTIPNVSACVFRRDPLIEIMERNIDFIRSFRIAGDWAVYAKLLQRDGKCAFVAESLNNHRRHSGGVTQQGYGERIVSEIQRMQRTIAAEVPLAASAQQHAASYVRKLQRQFDLPSED